MKKPTLFLIAVLWASIAGANDDFSILYPKQIQPKQPKLTTRQQCELDNEWKKYGSLKDCIDEKRHEEVLAQQNKIARRQEELAAQAAQERRSIRDEARTRHGLDAIRQSVKALSGNSR